MEPLLDAAATGAHPRRCPATTADDRPATRASTTRPTREPFLDERAHEIRVLCDYRDQLMHERNRLIGRLRWHLVRIAPEVEAQIGPAPLK